MRLLPADRRSFAAEAAAVLLSAAAILAAASRLPLVRWSAEVPLLLLALLFWLVRGRRAARVALAAVGVALAVRPLADWRGVPLAIALSIAAAFWTRRAPGRASPGLAAGKRNALRRAAWLAALALSGASAILTFHHGSGWKKRAEKLMELESGAARGAKRPAAPLAERLRGHVRVLAAEIGERDVYRRESQARARGYVHAQFASLGCGTRSIPYPCQDLLYVPDGTLFYNVEAVLPAASKGGSGVWVVGAHYDTAPGTPGADDNASGVAVLIELARLLQARGAGREVRFVAFGTEEPPAFGTKNMGSYHYAERAARDRLDLRGMISLEMVGYYSSSAGSQTYPYMLDRIFPARGDFIGFVSNLGSARFLWACRRAFRARSAFPLVCAVLPGPWSSVALSDQLNFWSAGFPAFMVSDTAFYRYPHYHLASDTPEKLDYERMALLTEALADMIAFSR